MYFPIIRSNRCWTNRITKFYQTKRLIQYRNLSSTDYKNITQDTHIDIIENTDIIFISIATVRIRSNIFPE